MSNLIKRKYSPFIFSTILIVLYFIFSLVIEKVIVYSLNFENISIFLNKYIYFVDTSIYIILLVILLLYFRKTNVQLKKTINIKVTFLIIALVLLLSVLEFIYNNFEFLFLNKEISRDIIVNQKIELISDFINVVLLSSIFEELAFRKIVIDFFEESNGIVQPLVTSSVLFTLIHFINLEFSLKNGLVFFTYGLFYSFLYIKTRNVLYPIIAHVTTNFIWLLLKVYQNSYEDIILFLNNSFFLIFITLMFLVSIIFLLNKISVLQKRY